MDLSCYLCFVFDFVILSCLFLTALWSPVVKGLTSWLSCIRDVFLCFCHFPMRCPGSGLVLDCIIPDCRLPYFSNNSIKSINYITIKYWFRNALL